MAELNFTIDNTALEQVRTIDLKANFDEMKAGLTAFAEPYKNLVVTEDSISESKNDRARLRKIATSIEDRRKLVKKIYNEPVKVFEARCKELTDILTTAATNIDIQVKAFEERKRDEKMFDLLTYFNDHEKQHPDYIKWEQIKDDRWGNATFSIDDAKSMIDQAIVDSDTAVSTILSLHSEYEVSILNEYRNTHNIYKALSLNDQLAETARRRKEQEERMAKMREEQARRAAEMSRQAKEVREQIEAEKKAEPESFEDKPVVVRKTLQITATVEGMKALEEFMRLHFISYKEIG